MCGNTGFSVGVEWSSFKIGEKGRKVLTCPDQGCLAQAEYDGYQSEGGEVHAPWSPLLPKGTVSSIHYVAVASRPARAGCAGCVGSYPLTESQSTTGTRLDGL